ncbi:MAG: sigma-70 family RNA polymerase sigma factor [Planctomycetota bacterium]
MSEESKSTKPDSVANEAEGENQTPWTDPEYVARYEDYLRMLARTHLRPQYQAKIGASDIVQQTMLQAVRASDQFRGESEPEYRGWLRQILVRQMCHLDRDLHRDKRDVRREQSMQAAVDGSSLRLEGLLAGGDATPSQHVAGRESVARLAKAIAGLPDAQRDAIELHYLQGLKLTEVAEQLGKTTGAIAGLLHRGMKQLRAEVQKSD